VRLALAAALALVFGAMLLVIWPSGHEVAIDIDVARWMTAHRGPLGGAIAVAAAALGSTPMLVAIGVWSLVYSRDKLFVLVACGGATLLHEVIARLVERPRPDQPIRVFDEISFSFPSGHATQGVVYWLVLAVVVGRARWPFAVAAAITCASRVYLCQHWLTDVIAGAALGGAWLVLSDSWLRRRGRSDAGGRRRARSRRRGSARAAEARRRHHP